MAYETTYDGMETPVESRPAPTGLQLRPSEAEESERQEVEKWTRRIRAAKAFRKDDTDRIVESMDFAYGLQWVGQKKIIFDKYTANVTLKNVNQKVSILYAKNPKAEYVPRPRLNFELYDGRPESLLPILQQAASNPLGFLGLPTEAKATIIDYMAGMEEQEQVRRVGQTIQYMYQWCFDEHDPSMLEQMKSLVRRTITCCVGFVRIGFERDTECELDDGTGNDILEMARRAKYILQQIEEGEVAIDSSQVEDLRQYVASIADEQEDIASGELQERLSFTFPKATSIIVDPKCTNLVGFIGASWIVHERIMPLDEVNAYFETNISPNNDVKLYGQRGDEEKPGDRDSGAADRETGRNVCVWEVFNKKAKNTFFLVDGYKKYVASPGPLPFEIYGFWPIRALVFNEVEVDPGCQGSASIYPPSDVDLMRNPQKERNRQREDLRHHRKANIPLYLVVKGFLSDTDKARILAADPSEIVETNGPPPQGMTINDMIVPKTKVPIDPLAYDTSQTELDIQYAVGSQEANLGPAPTKGTATGQNIAEQSRMTAASSNVDDLDLCLSWMARVGGEIILQRFSPDVIRRVVGRGAVVPSQQQEREDFMNSVYLSTKAASSGRPNKAVDLHNWGLVQPGLAAAGANPQFLVRETLKRLDDSLDPDEAFPLVPMGAMKSAVGPGPSEAMNPGVTPPPAQGRPGPGPLGDTPKDTISASQPADQQPMQAS